jgi:hypothetical protein
VNQTRDKVELIPLSEGELAVLVCQGHRIECAFGTGGVALIWDREKPIPSSVRALGLMRGVLNENMDGAGI